VRFIADYFCDAGEPERGLARLLPKRSNSLRFKRFPALCFIGTAATKQFPPVTKPFPLPDAELLKR
jgi:hypothetical protein